MDHTLWTLLAAAVAFPAIHIFLSSRRLRGRLVGLLGLAGFKGLYSLAVLASLAWLIWAFTRVTYVEMWPTTALMHLVQAVLMLAATYFLFGALTTPNPNFVPPAAAKKHNKRSIDAQGIVKITRQPMMWAVILWAIAHIAAVGSVGALMFFGAFIVLAVLGSFHMETRKAREHGKAWQDLVKKTSYVPFRALIEGRTSVTMAELGWWRILGSVALYIVFVLGHEWLLGVNPLIY